MDSSRNQLSRSTANAVVFSRSSWTRRGRWGKGVGAWRQASKAGRVSGGVGVVMMDDLGEGRRGFFFFPILPVEGRAWTDGRAVAVLGGWTGLGWCVGWVSRLGWVGGSVARSPNDGDGGDCPKDIGGPVAAGNCSASIVWGCPPLTLMPSRTRRFGLHGSLAPQPHNAHAWWRMPSLLGFFSPTPQPHNAASRTGEPSGTQMALERPPQTHLPQLP